MSKYKAGQKIKHGDKSLTICRVIPKKSGTVLVCRSSKGKRVDVKASALERKDD